MQMMQMGGAVGHEKLQFQQRNYAKKTINTDTVNGFLSLHFYWNNSTLQIQQYKLTILTIHKKITKFIKKNPQKANSVCCMNNLH